MPLEVSILFSVSHNTNQIGTKQILNIAKSIGLTHSEASVGLGSGVMNTA